MAATYVLISSQVLGTAAASVTFSSIPQTYTDLVIKSSTSLTNATGAQPMQLTFNNDTATNYSETYLYNSSNSAGSGQDFNRANSQMFVSTSGTNFSGFTSAEIYIPNYASATTKQFFLFGGPETNGTSGIFTTIQATLYRGTSAITTIVLSSNGTGGSFATNSSFYLYGIRNS